MIFIFNKVSPSLSRWKASLKEERLRVVLRPSFQSWIDNL